jgi:hypothetical protein
MPGLIEENPLIAFGRVPTAYFTGIKPENYEFIDNEALEAANPKTFLPFLLPGRAKGKERSFVVDGVALDEYEYERVVRNIGAFSGAIANTTHKARLLDPRAERRGEVAERSVDHALESKQEAMLRTLAGVAKEKDVLKKLEKEARSPGYAHVRARDMQEMAVSAVTIYFMRVLDVVQRQRGWSTEERQLMQDATTVRLFLGGRERVGNWQSWLKVARIYASEREKLFRNRVERTEKILGQTAVSEAS